MLRAKQRAFKIVLSSDQARHFFCQQLRQLCVALAGQVHEVHLVELAVLCIEEVHALPLTDDAELPGHTGRFFHTEDRYHRYSGIKDKPLVVPVDGSYGYHDRRIRI